MKKIYLHISILVNLFLIVAFCALYYEYSKYANIVGDHAANNIGIINLSNGEEVEDFRILYDSLWKLNMGFIVSFNSDHPDALRAAHDEQSKVKAELLLSENNRRKYWNYINQTKHKYDECRNLPSPEAFLGNDVFEFMEPKQ